jgi:hypothetical protein
MWPVNAESCIPGIKGLATQGVLGPLAQFVADQDFTLSGVTYDSTNAALGTCNVDLFITGTDVLAARTVSDPTTGAYLIYVSPAFTYYAVGYKAGGTDVSGTTRNDLVPS